MEQHQYNTLVMYLQQIEKELKEIKKVLIQKHGIR